MLHNVPNDITREKVRDLTQSYDKSSDTHIKTQKGNLTLQKKATKYLRLKQRLKGHRHDW